MPYTRGNLLKCREPSCSRAPAYATAAVMGAGFVFSMAMCWPGHLSYDSVVQLLEGRTAAYSGWHPPVMSWLLGLSDWLMPGTGLYLAITELVFFLSLVSMIWLRTRIPWAAPAIAALCVLTPQFALYQGTVWKDVLFANATIAGFVIQAHVASNWSPPAARYRGIALSSVFFVLATLTRQNGAISLIAGTTSLFFIWESQIGRWGPALLGSVAVFLLSALLAFAATWALSARLFPEAGLSQQVKRLELYDLVGALATDPTLRLPILEHEDLPLLRIMRRDGVRLYSPVRSDTLAGSQRLQNELARAPNSVLQAAWVDLIVRHPVDYLRTRADAFHWVLLTPDISLCVPYVVGLRGPPQAMEALGLRTRLNQRDQWADTYGKALLGTPAFSHITFLVLSLGEMAFLIRRRRPADISMLGMLAGAIVFASSFFFVSLACDYRYIYALDLAALVALLYIALDPAFDAQQAGMRTLKWL